MLTICRYLCKHTNCGSENLNVYICFSYSKDQHVCCCFAPTQTRSNEGECKILLQKHKVLKMELIGRVQNLSGEGLWTFPLSGGECVNSAFWSQSEIERLLVRRTAEGLRHNQSTPPHPPGTVRMFYMWLSPSCSLMKKESVKVLQTTCDMLMFQAS